MISMTTLAIMCTAASMTWLMINPLTLALTILVMALSVALLFGMYLSSWMAFLVFLIYIGGMMVMFAYFVAMAPNTPMNMTWPAIFSISTLTLLTTFMMTNPFKPNSSTMSSMMLNTFYSMEHMETLLMLALILLLTMIIVVKLVSLTKGPLRPFN